MQTNERKKKTTFNYSISMAVLIDSFDLNAGKAIFIIEMAMFHLQLKVKRNKSKIKLNATATAAVNIYFILFYLILISLYNSLYS